MEVGDDREGCSSVTLDEMMLYWYGSPTPFLCLRNLLIPSPRADLRTGACHVRWPSLCLEVPRSSSLEGGMLGIMMCRD